MMILPLQFLRHIMLYKEILNIMQKLWRHSYLIMKKYHHIRYPKSV